MLMFATASLNEMQKQQLDVYLGFCAASEPVIVGLRLFLLKVMQVQYPQAKNLVEHEELAFSLMRSLKCHPLLKIFDKGYTKDKHPCVSLCSVTQKQIDEAYSEYCQ
jgi:hypothetical protein